MYHIKDIKKVHLEISSKCNARCPQCPRNFRGYPYNDGYPETNLTLEQVQDIFYSDFVQQLDSIHINGNYGDMIMNPETIDIVEYFRSHNDQFQIRICTNASAKPETFWKRLAELNCEIEFALDGLEDTHAMYRQNTSWQTVIRNAKTFISAGGYAIWKFIKFKHNQHQLTKCEHMSKQLGFSKFKTVNDGRDQGPVYDRQGWHVYNMGDWTAYNEDDDCIAHDTVFHAIQRRKDVVMLLEDVAQHETPKSSISCQAKNKKEIYITANGEVYPCCWLGMYPKTNTGFGTDQAVINQQLQPMIGNNNALEHELEDCIAWFNRIEQSWSCSTYEDGRLIQCDRVCGK